MGPSSGTPMLGGGGGTGNMKQASKQARDGQDCEGVVQPEQKPNPLQQHQFRFRSGSFLGMTKGGCGCCSSRNDRTKRSGVMAPE